MSLTELKDLNLTAPMQRFDREESRDNAGETFCHVTGEIFCPPF